MRRPALSFYAQEQAADPIRRAAAAPPIRALAALLAERTLCTHRLSPPGALDAPTGRIRHDDAGNLRGDRLCPGRYVAGYHAANGARRLWQADQSALRHGLL